MKKLKYFIVSLVVLIIAGGCNEDILDKNYKDQLSPENFYNNTREAKMGLMGVYESISKYGGDNVPIHFYQFEFMSDNFYAQDAWQGSQEFGAWTQNSSSWAAWSQWQWSFQTIGRANKFLEGMEQASFEEDEETEKQMIAEARFLRAYVYTQLIHLFGDVPLVHESMTLEEAEVERDPKQDVLEATLDDYDYAIDNLPVTQEETGRATKGAAYAYKARTLLYNEQWEDAAEACQEVINLDVYSLYPNYRDLFKEEYENNSEVIFDKQYIRGQAPQPWPSTSLSFLNWPTPNVTISLVDAYYTQDGMPIEDDPDYDPQDPYENRDPRLAATCILPGSEIMEGGSIHIPANDEVPSGVRPRKYSDPYNSDVEDCAINRIMMRYADVLLMRAEALIESGNTGQEVYDLINEVRQRPSVNMPTVEEVEGTDLSQDELRDILRHERRVELAMEGTRYWDMLRWEDESLIHDVYGYDIGQLSNPDNPDEWVFETVKIAERQFDPEKGWLWPIPYEEIQNNSNLTQNPGYGN